MCQLLENGDLAHDLGHSRRIASKLILLDELDRNLDT